MQPLGAVRPDMSAPSPVRTRPHGFYKSELRARLRDLAPRSLVDVGCGEGTLLAHMTEAGCERCIGLDVDDAFHARLAEHGIEAVTGRAEALPFPDRSIDVVVMEYSAHHVADLGTALAEAARVAAKAVVILDPWYDLSIASQVVARDFDLWCKKIDVRLGLVHNPCPSLGDLCGPFLENGGFSIEATHRLILHHMPCADVEADAAAHLARLADDRADFEPEIADILEAAWAKGISDDGAIQFVALRT
ncbi:class I SAM-dependent methyltransferase [Sphingopyxis kveilinensis]|uniref:class I SAM-dependent methyltransferase n=1 Tax=Sphingopyxis kveilinensis TaxID=3114367 RepID=UPI0030CBD1EF